MIGVRAISYNYRNVSFSKYSVSAYAKLNVIFIPLILTKIFIYNMIHRTFAIRYNIFFSRDIIAKI